MTSKIKVDNINKVSDDSNIIKKCGSTITLGASGDSIALASGASQTGFGRTGTVDWQTGSIKTSTFTAVNGEGYFVNTTGGAVTANLPAGSAGAIVSFSDYTRTFGTNSLTVTPNGSEKIGGTAASIFLNVNGQALTLVYVDATEGWINIQNAEDTEEGIVPAFIAATGGTITTVCTNFKVHTFTGPGTFCVSNSGNAAGSNTVSYMVIAGGASAALDDRGGGGGAGGFRESKSPFCTFTASPNAATGGLAVTGAIPITVGAGGTSQTSSNSKGNDGSSSIFSTITSTGGGGGGHGGSYGDSSLNGKPGGSGGGGGGSCNANPSPFNGGTGGSGNTPTVSPPQGKDGGKGNHEPGVWAAGGGGGGAGAVGQNASERPTPGPSAVAGNGGAGVTTSITGSPVTRTGGGGGAGSAASASGSGGSGGGGDGSPSNAGGAGTTNTGSGGGGANNPAPGSGAGGSGIVVIRYRFQ